jgi:hypothetical protein
MTEQKNQTRTKWKLPYLDKINEKIPYVNILKNGCGYNSI